MEGYTNSYKVNHINIKISRFLPGFFVAADEGEATEAVERVNTLCLASSKTSADAVALAAAVAASAAKAATAAAFPFFLAVASAILERLFPSVEVGMAAEAAACPPPLLVVARVTMGDLMAEKDVSRAAAGAVASDAAACTPPRVVRRGTMGEWRALAAVLAVAAAAAAAAAACPTPRVVARVTKGELPALEAVAAAAAAVAFPPPGVVVRCAVELLMALAAVAAEAAAVAASAASAAAKRRATPRWLGGGVRLNRAMVDDIGEEVILWELGSYKQYKNKGIKRQHE